MNTYDRYKELRDRKGVNDSTVAGATGIPKSTFSDWKNGRSKPKMEKIMKIADYFGVPVDYLTGNEDIPRTSVVRDSGSSYHKGPDLSPLALEVAAAFDDSDPVRQETVCDVLKIPYRKLKGREGGSIA